MSEGYLDDRTGCDEVHLHDDLEGLEPVAIENLGLIANASTAAAQLQRDHPGVIFTSGRRDVDRQASAMAGHIAGNRQWIAQTYRQSAERDQLQAWVNANPGATTAAQIATGLRGIMTNWTDRQKARLSRHFAGLAFDVSPRSGPAVRAAIPNLPNLVYHTFNEGGAEVWHAEFSPA